MTAQMIFPLRREHAVPAARRSPSISALCGRGAASFSEISIPTPHVVIKS